MAELDRVLELRQVRGDRGERAEQHRDHRQRGESRRARTAAAACARAGAARRGPRWRLSRGALRRGDDDRRGTLLAFCAGCRRRRSCDRSRTAAQRLGAHAVRRAAPLRVAGAAGRGSCSRRAGGAREFSRWAAGLRGTAHATARLSADPSHYDCRDGSHPLRRSRLAVAQRSRLPAGGRARGQARSSAGRCASSSGWTRPRPTSPRAYGGAPEAARVPGRRPHGRADHRRRHGARRRSERPLVDAPDAERRGDQGQRRHLPGAGDEGARPGAAGGPLQRRLARHVDGGAVPAACRRPRSRTSSSARTLPSGSRRGRRSRCWSCSTRCCRATTRSRSRPTSSSAGPTRSSICCWAATSSAPTGSPSRWC